MTTCHRPPTPLRPRWTACCGPPTRPGSGGFTSTAIPAVAPSPLRWRSTHGDRVLTLAIDEPASDFTDPGNADYGWPEFDRILRLPPNESTAEFLKLQVAPGVALAPPPGGPPPAWMAKRPAGVRAFIEALRAHHVTEKDYRSFEKPVYFSWGSLTHQRWGSMERRLSKLFPDFSSEMFEGLHHLNTSHAAEPQRVAARLTTLWQRAG